MGTQSDCYTIVNLKEKSIYMLTLLVNLKEKMYLYVNSTSKLKGKMYLYCMLTLLPKKVSISICHRFEVENRMALSL